MRIDCVYRRTQGSQETELRLKVKAVVGYLFIPKEYPLSNLEERESLHGMHITHMYK